LVLWPTGMRRPIKDSRLMIFGLLLLGRCGYGIGGMAKDVCLPHTNALNPRSFHLCICSVSSLHSL
jgi:hypothetical protein